MVSLQPSRPLLILLASHFYLFSLVLCVLASLGCSNKVPGNSGGKLEGKKDPLFPEISVPGQWWSPAPEGPGTLYRHPLNPGTAEPNTRLVCGVFPLSFLFGFEPSLTSHHLT